MKGPEHDPPGKKKINTRCCILFFLSFTISSTNCLHELRSNAQSGVSPPNPPGHLVTCQRVLFLSWGGVIGCWSLKKKTPLGVLMRRRKNNISAVAPGSLSGWAAENGRDAAQASRRFLAEPISNWTPVLCRRGRRHSGMYSSLSVHDSQPPAPTFSPAPVIINQSDATATRLYNNH